MNNLCRFLTLFNFFVLLPRLYFFKMFFFTLLSIQKPRRLFVHTNQHTQNITTTRNFISFIPHDQTKKDKEKKQNHSGQTFLFKLEILLSLINRQWAQTTEPF
jgi:hypothetical protein